MHLTTLTLDLRLHPGDLPGFRACIAELAGFEHTGFHNHRPDRADTDRDWAYPLIQYAVRRGKATVIGLDAGASAIRKQLIPNLEETLAFAGKTHAVPAFGFRDVVFAPEILMQEQPFALSGWLALHADNYGRWKAAATDRERLDLLSRALTGHLRCFAEALGVPDHKAIVGRVLRVDRQKKIRWHGVDLVRFDVLAAANLLLPTGIGLGRAAAFGFGEVCDAAHYERWRTRIRTAELRFGENVPV